MKVKSKLRLIMNLLLCIVLILFSAYLLGCSGDDGAQGPPGTVDPATLTSAANTAAISAVELAAIKSESCEACHGTAGSDHQAFYDQLNQIDAKGIQVSNVTYGYAAGTATVSFKMTKAVPYAGANFDCREADSLSLYWAAYNGTIFPANPAQAAAEGRSTLKGTLAYNSTTGVCTSTYSTVDYGDLSLQNGIIVVYGYDELVKQVTGTRIRGVKYPFAAVKKTGTVGYASAANVAGCEKCHTVPYVKHGNILGATKADSTPTTAATSFYTCKACHLDDGEGGHFEWGLAVNDPTLAASYDAGKGTALTAAQELEYAYKTTLMNDVHMSHAMEFPYPQSMSNCVVCHEGKIASINTDAQFKLDTCKSCHPFKGTNPLALPTLAGHAMPTDGICNNCHKASGIAPAFSAIHSGYDKIIYAAPDKKYKDIFAISIDSASLSGTDLTIKFKATKTDPTSATTLAVTSIKPKVIVGLYGYRTKDFIVDAHGANFDDNGDGKIQTRNCGTACDFRNLEYDVGDGNPRFVLVSAANGQWEVKAKLANWANLITDGTVKRVEIAVLPALPDANNNNVPVSTASKTFDLTKNAFDATYFKPIVKVAEGATVAAGGCDNCHGALGRTFHSAQYGNAGVVGCRLCHTTRSGGGHLEMQSRSIDSYVHAIHSFQPFDIQSINFNDAFTKMEYKLETGGLGATAWFVYPTFFTQNCKSCHQAGTFDVPDQYKSLGGTLSKSQDKLIGLTRNISGVPSYVTGPAARACGSCHRTKWINKDDAGALAAFSQHTKDNGYRVEATDSTVFDTVITKIMSAFK